MTGQLIDLRGMPFMPLYIDRLQKSKAWLICKREPELAFYLMNLWMRAWQEVPAGTLENDDDVLADAAMCDPKRWLKLKEKILRGWIEHGGRISHPVVGEIAAESWEKREAYQRRTEKARQAKAQKRDTSITKPETEPVIASVTDVVTTLKGERQGEGQGQGDEERKITDTPVTRSRPEGVALIRVFDEARVKAFGESRARPNPAALDLTVASRWIEAGATVELVQSVVGAICGRLATDGQEPPDTLKFFDKAIARAIAEAKRPMDLEAPRVNGHRNGTPSQHVGDPDLDRWRSRVRVFRSEGQWLPMFGPKPGEPGCRAPPEVLRENGFVAA